MNILLMKSVYLVGFLIATLVSVSAHAAKLRLGWQIPWALQGQLVQILKHSEILKKQGLEVEFVGRTFGPELNELALAQQVDVILTGDQPAATLFGKSEDWVGVARLMYNRTATYVPLQSSIKTVKDLAGKTLGLPIGAAAERIITEKLQQAGVNAKLINLGILEHLPLISRSKLTATKWDQFDALSGFDPTPAILENKKLARILEVGKVCSLVVMSRSFLAAHKVDAGKLVSALSEAYLYLQKNTRQANQWYLEEAKLKDVDDATLALANSLEPNLNLSRPSLEFSEEDFQILQRAADFAAQKGGRKIEMKSRVSNQFLK